MLKALTAGKRCRKVVFGSNEAPPFLLSTVPLLKDMNAVGVKNQAAGYEKSWGRCVMTAAANHIPTNCCLNGGAPGRKLPLRNIHIQYLWMKLA